MKKIITISFIIIFSIGFSQEKQELANSLFEKMEYLKAAQLFEKELLQKGSSKELLQKIADAYYFNIDMRSANKWYGKLISEYENEVKPKYFFRYSQSFKGIDKLNAEKKWMKRFVEKQIEKNYDSIKVENIQNNSDYSLKNISINTMYREFGAAYYGDKLIYSSAKDSSYYNMSKAKQNTFLNLYIGDLELNNTDVTSSKKISKDAKSKFHEATLCFTKDLKKVYYTRNNYSKYMNNGVANKLKIFSATVEKNDDGKVKWSNFKELPFNSNLYSTGHPALSEDGKKLYFVSDMPGTIGETDIFVVDVLPNNKYSKPKNLGPIVNTLKKEMFPYFVNNKLYFSSNGYSGLGGLDVFESEYSKEIYKTPANLGEPINSSFDDFGYIIKEDLNTGFVCSNRVSGKGDDDIYFFERTRVGICKQLISGYISNNITGERISESKIVLYNKEGEKLEETLSDLNGNYKFHQDLECDTEYLIKVERIGYKNGEKVIRTNKNLDEVEVPIGLDRIHKLIIEENGLLKIKIGIIYFDLNKFEIRKDAAKEFDKIVSLMNEYPKMIIDIESHTDSRGPDKFNYLLSDKRAKAGRDYIIDKGISADRIRKAKGFGETQLMNKCQNGVHCSESMHQLNRRSEFIIIKM